MKKIVVAMAIIILSLRAIKKLKKVYKDKKASHNYNERAGSFLNLVLNLSKKHLKASHNLTIFSQY